MSLYLSLYVYTLHPTLPWNLTSNWTMLKVVRGRKGPLELVAVDPLQNTSLFAGPMQFPFCFNRQVQTSKDPLPPNSHNHKVHVFLAQSVCFLPHCGGPHLRVFWLFFPRAARVSFPFSPSPRTPISNIQKSRRLPWKP